MELLVYKASAGSGKTFTLAVEYIKQLILNPSAYRHILAVTFTNKATTEMKERILQQLYGIWQADEKSRPYLNAIKERLAGGAAPALLPDDEIRRRAGEALRLMLHDYSRFRVETIDSFFQSVMRNLARELELSPNLNIELNNQEVLATAVDSMIEKLSPTSPVLAWLMEYIGQRISEDKQWNVADELKRFGRNIFDESYIERGERVREWLREPLKLKLYRDVMRALEAEALEEMGDYYTRFVEALDSYSLLPDELKSGTRGIDSYFRKLRDGKLSDKETQTATLQKHLNSTTEWASKSSPRKEEIYAAATSTLLPLLQEAEQTRHRMNRQLNSARLSTQHLSQLQLLNHIDEEVRTLNQEHNRFLLSDTNALLHALMKEGDSSFVFEKIGAQIRTVMIDEFQDTSRLQWDNFRLLLLEGLSQGADSLIVGDVKQSIYRWRNGDWGILNSLGAKLNEERRMKNEEPQGKRTAGFENSSLFTLHSSFPIRVKTLTTNRRSEANIIHFNNALFEAAVRYLNDLHLAELNEECIPLKQAYLDVAQASPKETAKGYVRANFLQPTAEADYTQLTLQALGEEVRDLMAKGVRPADMAILVRKNKAIPAIADYFDRELGLPIVSDEAFRMDASPALCRLMEALRMVAHPEDGIAQSIINEEPKMRDEALTSLPLYELIQQLYHLLELEKLPQQEGYLFAFFDAVTEFLQRGGADLHDFIRHWDETLCAKTIPGGEVEGIRIFSIHKSKGLEFHTVLIPFCDWKLENETTNQLVWCSTNEHPYNDLALVPINYSPVMAESTYRDDYLHERLQLWVDNLNLLYVAFTRPEKNLIFWSKAGARGTIGELLAATLPAEAQEGIGQVMPSTNEADRQTDNNHSSSSAGSQHPSRNRLTQPSLPVTATMHAVARPRVRFLQSNRSAEFLAGDEEGIHSPWRFINRGKLLHELFAGIRTTDDVEAAIQRLLFEGIISSHDEEQELRDIARHALALDEVKDWYSGTWQLFNECDIIWRGTQGELCNRRPDRVMMRGDELVVIDFKFGQPRNSYRKQVRQYMELLRRMGYEKKHISGYLWYVDADKVEKVEAAHP